MSLSKSFWARVGLMVFSLIAVLYAMHYLKAGKPSYLGALPKPSDTFNLCPTRVAWIEYSAEGGSNAGQWRLEQTGSKWFRGPKGGTPLEVDPIAVEKWLSSFCSALTRETKSLEAAAFVPLLQIGYITGTPQTLLQSKAGVEYQLDGHHFTSHDLDEALHTIAKLPANKPPGTP